MRSREHTTYEPDPDEVIHGTSHKDMVTLHASGDLNNTDGFTLNLTREHIPLIEKLLDALKRMDMASSLRTGVRPWSSTSSAC